MMRVNKLLWGLWIAMIASMLLRQKADTYMVVALIIIPILIVLLDLHEEIVTLKEENKHQRKFVLDRYNILSERVTDISNQVEKRLVVDFAEFAQNTPPPDATEPRLPPRSQARRKTKKRRRPDSTNPAAVPTDFAQAPSDIEPQDTDANTPPATS